MSSVSPARAVCLAPYTTMRVGGPAAFFDEVSNADALVERVCAADALDRPLFVLGGGSNVVVGDEGFDGCVVHTIGGAIHPLDDGGQPGGCIRVRVEVGTPWDAVVAWAVEHDLRGVEALSGIPGQIGSAVMQNLGAYGQEVGGSLAEVRLLDRADGSVRTWQASELKLGYRTSMLRASMDEVGSPWHPSPRWIVLDATLALVPDRESVVAHPQLARALNCEVGAAMPLADIRAAVLGVRTAKGMVGDDDPTGSAPRYDCWSSGSFFTNPVLSQREAECLLPPEAPRYEALQPDKVKTSAAWLIEHAGFERGFGLRGAESPATLSTLHTLALTNRGSACAADIIELARAVRAGVYERFGVRLEPESVLVGVEL